MKTVDAERRVKKVFPLKDEVFRAFLATPFEKVRLVIVGQDPYHGMGQANGLAFSVPREVPIPPSLMNIFTEAQVAGAHGDLTKWTEQGILLLNSNLTVTEGQALSHGKFGWEKLTDAAIRAVSREHRDVIFLLWGKEASLKARFVDKGCHVVLTAGHPSPLSYEKHFKGCGHFQKVNELLSARGDVEINWQP